MSQVCGMESLDAHCTLRTLQPGLVQLTISGAGSANVLSTPVIGGVTGGLRRLAADPAVRVLVLTGSGDRSFVGGADIAEMSALDPPGAEAFIRRLAGLCEAVRQFPAPVVARIQGWCLGGGLELAAACDLRVAAPSARFAMPEVKVGIPSVIHAALLPRLVGAGRARFLMLTGAEIDAATALAWGLVDAVAGEAGLDAAVATLAAPILACDPAVIAQQKTLLREWEERPLSEAIAATIPAFGRAFQTDGPRRAMQPFLEARAKKRGA